MATPVGQFPGVVPAVELGGIIERFIALVIDGFILGLVSIFIALPLHLVTFGLFFFIPFWAMAIVYESYFLSSPRQATPGKMAMGLVVRDINGMPVDLTKAIIRSACRFLSSVFFCLGYLLALFTDRRQTLHDLIAGTVVVKGR